jgi:hypothetical protein
VTTMATFIECPACRDGEISAEILFIEAEYEAGFLRLPAHAELVDYRITCGCVLTEQEIIAHARR